MGTKDAKDHRGCGGKVGQPFGQAWAASPMAILVPPPVLQEEDAILDLPVVADCRQQLGGGDRPWIDTREKVARVREPDGAIISDDIAVHAQRDLAAGKAERMADVLAVL